MTGLQIDTAGERMPEEADSKLLAGLSSFLGKHGLATVIALVFLWFMNEDRQATAKEREGNALATATQLRELNGQLSNVSVVLQKHHDEGQKSSEEWTRILLAQCLNLASEREERDRCMGLR